MKMGATPVPFSVNRYFVTRHVDLLNSLSTSVVVEAAKERSHTTTCKTSIKMDQVKAQQRQWHTVSQQPRRDRSAHAAGM